MMFWLTGLQAASVFSMMSGPGAKVDLYDAIAVRFRGGSIGTVSGAGNVPYGRPFHVDIRVFGSEGMLLLDCERARMELRRYDGDHTVAAVEPDAGAYECTGPPNNFADLILGKTATNLAPGWAGMRAIELLDAAYRSAVSGSQEEV
jgi:predicted dehydrogenase